MFDMSQVAATVPNQSLDSWLGRGERTTLGLSHGSPRKGTGVVDLVRKSLTTFKGSV